MQIIENGLPSDAGSTEAAIQTENQVPVAPDTESSQTVSDPKTDRKQNQSGDDTSADTETTPKPTKKLAAQPPSMPVLTIDDQLGIQTEIDKAHADMLDLVESMKTGRYMTDTIQGVEWPSRDSEPRAILYHGDWKVIIMASMMLKLPQDLRDRSPYEVYHYLLTKRLGAEIDYVIKGMDPDTGIAVASRQDAMATKRRHYFTNTTRDGTYRIYEGLCCEARVMSVIPEGIYIELFGIDLFIPLRELSHARIPDAMGYYNPGERVLVKITKLDRSDPEHIRVAASVKQVASNPRAKALEKLVIGSNYAGIVALLDEYGIIVHLNLGIDCRCKYPYRARPPKGARVVVKITSIDREKQKAWGAITYISIPKNWG